MCEELPEKGRHPGTKHFNFDLSSQLVRLLSVNRTTELTFRGVYMRLVLCSSAFHLSFLRTARRALSEW